MQLLRETNISTLNGQTFDRFETHKIILTTDELRVIKNALDKYDDEIVIYGIDSDKAEEDDKKLQNLVEEMTTDMETYIIDERINIE